MRTFPIYFVLAVLGAAALVIAREPRPGAPEAPAASETGVAVYFSPGGGCEAAIVAQIRGAKRSIDVQAYHLTSTMIAKALHEAHDRGVKVRAVLDEEAAGTKYSGATYLHNAGVP